MGCLTRVVGSAVLLGGVAAGAWWWTGGDLPVPAAIAEQLARVGGAADSLDTEPSRAFRRARWQPIDSAGSRRAAAQVAQLTRRGGPGMVTLEPGELVAFLVEPFAAQLPGSARAAQVAVSDGRVYVKADVRLVDLGLDASLGELLGRLDRRDTIVIGGAFDLLTEGLGQFVVEEVVMGAFSVPRPLVPRLASVIRKGEPPAGLSPGGFPVRLPAGVGDVRIRGDRVTLYRAAP